MGKKRFITLTTQSGNGTTIDLNNVAYIDKVEENYHTGIRFTFHSGAHKTLWYGHYVGERDRDFITVSNRL